MDYGMEDTKYWRLIDADAEADAGRPVIPTPSIIRAGSIIARRPVVSVTAGVITVSAFIPPHMPVVLRADRCPSSAEISIPLDGTGRYRRGNEGHACGESECDSPVTDCASHGDVPFIGFFFA
jgi:hypothetical protein